MKQKKSCICLNLHVAATCVRIPVAVGHSESVYFEMDKDGVSAEIKGLLENAPGIVLQDDPEQSNLSNACRIVSVSNDVFVGRIRKDLDVDKGFHMWVVSDNLLKGAAWNSVQIAESLIKLGLV